MPNDPGMGIIMGAIIMYVWKQVFMYATIAA